MSEIQFPNNRNEVKERIKTDVQINLPTSNPFLPASFLGAIITGLAGRIYDIYYQIKNILIRELFPDTATGEELYHHARLKNLTLNPATQAEGYITCTGTAGTAIPAGTTWQTTDGITLESQNLIDVSNQTLSVLSLTRSGATAIVTTASNHNLATGVSVIIAGAVETDYNGTFQIVVTGLDTFTYTLTATPTTPATGTIFASFTTASVLVKSQDFGQQANVSAGASVTIGTPIAGLASEAVVQYGEISGGADIETDAELQERLTEKWQNPGTPFAASNIEAKAKEVSGVTRVWVVEATPEAGKVTIYFTRDNDDSPIPSAGEVAEVKEKILTIKPAHTPDAYVIVNAPTALAINFTFTTLNPNTDEMKLAITEALEQFFSERVNVSENVYEDGYRSAIYNAIDATGASVVSFTLSTPSGDVSISAGYIGTLGVVTFS